MTPIQPINPNPMREAHAAPRCEHTRRNGQPCVAPALRGQTHCRFHKSIQYRALNAEDAEPYLPFIEDATSLQFALMRVIRLLERGGTSHRTCGLLLYSLQIAASNMKAFMAEQPRQELPEAEGHGRKSSKARKRRRPMARALTNRKAWRSFCWDSSAIPTAAPTRRGRAFAAARITTEPWSRGNAASPPCRAKRLAAKGRGSLRR